MMLPCVLERFINDRKVCQAVATQVCRQRADFRTGRVPEFRPDLASCRHGRPVRHVLALPAAVPLLWLPQSLQDFD